MTYVLRRVLGGSGFALLCNFALAQTPPDSGGGGLEEIVVTGSLLRSTTLAEEGAAPIDVISVDEIRLRGNTSVFEAVRNLPQLAGYQDNDTRAGARDTKEVNLRGLGAQYTVVLLNGRRLGQNNLNLIPFAAVERIEVLKDGASAVYGSDALAGVVNIITRKSYDGAEFSLDYGNTTHYADGGRTNASALLGSDGERGKFMITGQYEHWNAVSSLDHPLGRTDDLRRFGSIDRRFQANNPGNIRLANGTRVMLNPSFGVGQTGASLADYGAVYDNKIEKQRPNNMQNDRSGGAFFGSGSYSLVDERLEVFADFLYKSINVNYVDHRGTILDLDVPATNFWNPFGQTVRVTYQLDYRDGRQERPLESLQGDIDTRMLTAGFRGVIGPVDYSIAYSDWRSDDLQAHDGLSRSGIIAQLARTDSSALNLFGNAAVTPEQLAPARALFRRELSEYVRSVTGVARFEPFSLPAGGVAAAVGFETRTQGFDSILDESLNTAKDSISLTFLNDFSLGLERDIDAYFAEMNVPITGAESNFAGARALDLTLAARRESFSDFGDATVKRATLRWQPFESDALTFRTSYSESFYAPELRDILLLGDSNTNIYVDPLIVDANGAPIRYTMTTIGGGNPDLQPTTGEYLNFGLIFKPQFLDGLRVMLDVWHLDQEKAFVYPAPQGVINGTSPGTVERSSTLLPGETIGRITTVTARTANAATRTVRGVDLNLSYTMDVGAPSRLTIDSNNTFTTRFIYDQKDGRGPQNALGQVSSYFSMDVVPRFRSDLVLGYGIGPFNATLSTSYTRGVVNPLDNWAKIDDYMRSDLSASIDLSGFGMFGETTAWLRVQDVFDEGVPYVFGRTAGVTSDYTYADFIGQFVTVGVRTKF